MKKLLMSMMAIALVCFASCEPRDPGKPDGGETIPESFPRKFLIEHFTGEACPYCPMGMEGLEEFCKADPDQYIWVSHHAGYMPDQYTIPANNTIVNLLGVRGAPSAAINRSKQQSYDDYGRPAQVLVFHPGNLPLMTVTDEKTAVASVNIKPTYDAGSRALTVEVSGLVADSTIAELQLSVLIKENGLVSQQADAGTWSGWNKYRHVRVVREMLSEAKGDVVIVDKQKYTKTYTTTLKADMNADNCMVVAYITEVSKKVTPIINAEQVAIVEGKGGEDLWPEGLEIIPVDEDFPEEGSPIQEIVIDQKPYIGEYDPSVPGMWLIQMLSNSTVDVKYQGQTFPCNPLMNILIPNSTNKDLKPGVYPIDNSGKDGTVLAGFRNDEEFYIDGSVLFYAFFEQQGKFYALAQWLIVDGQLELKEDGSLTLDATTLNGSTFKATYTATPAGGDNVAPRLIRENRMMMSIAEK